MATVGEPDSDTVQMPHSSRFCSQAPESNSENTFLIFHLPEDAFSVFMTIRPTTGRGLGIGAVLSVVQRIVTESQLCQIPSWVK